MAPLVYGFVPGSLPIGLAVALWLAGRGAAPVVFRPIDDERFATVRAHQNFRAALRDRSDPLLP